MICSCCRGSGSLLGTRWGLAWWTCPACNGDGVQAANGPKTFAEARKRKAHIERTTHD